MYRDAIYEIDIVALTAGDVFLDFFLPPRFVEFQSNQELRNIVTMTARIQADLQFCTPACSRTTDTLFQWFSELEGGYDSYSLSNGALSVNPLLDTSPLVHQNVDVVDTMGFTRTRTWSYDAFTGSIPLGHFGAGQTFTVRYRLIADTFSDFPTFETWAAGAINDPFMVRDIFTFRQLEDPALIPEPSTFGFLARGIRTLFAIRAIRRRRV